MTIWHILTGEYPPQPGGVSDYTRLLARGLATAGDEVHVWAPICMGPDSENDGVAVHRLPGRFGPRALQQLGRALRRERQPYRLLVQYVPHMYGWKAMNVPFCLWLLRQRGSAPWVMFHEVAFPCRRRQRLTHRVLGIVTHVMAGLVARAAERVFVSIPAWEAVLRKVAPCRNRITWLPVPSNVATETDSAAVAKVRADLAPQRETVILGHFGTFGGEVAAQLAEVLPRLLRADGRRLGLLIGRGSEVFAQQLALRHPSLQGQLRAAGERPPEEVATYLRACDLLVQPYPDGASSRRGSLMAGLALGLPIVTSHGPLTEPVFQEEEMAALTPAGETETVVTTVEELLRDASYRRRLGRQAQDGYRRHFALEHTIEILRQADQAAEERLFPVSLDRGA